MTTIIFTTLKYVIITNGSVLRDPTLEYAHKRRRTGDNDNLQLTGNFYYITIVIIITNCSMLAASLFTTTAVARVRNLDVVFVIFVASVVLRDNIVYLLFK